MRNKNDYCNLEELTEVAPIIPPKKIEQILDEKKDTQGTIDINVLVALAPFLDEEYLDQLADQVSISHFSQLACLAPFLEDDTLSRIALCYKGPIDNLISIAPFLEEKTLTELASRYEGSIEELVILAPFLEEACLDTWVEKYLVDENCDLYMLTSLCPFLDSVTVRKIADYCMKKNAYDVLSSFAPFM